MSIYFSSKYSGGIKAENHNEVDYYDIYYFITVFPHSL